LEAGMAGSFLQTPMAAQLKNLFQTQGEMSDNDRTDVLSFLSGSSEYIPQSGQITGILKQLGDEMDKNLMDATAEEDASIKSYEAMMAAKTKEVNVLTAAIEAKTIRSGETAVQITEMKHDLSTTEATLLEDKSFLADLEKNCAQKEAEYQEMKKTRSEEQLAITETISLLNDDDSLELFKKTLPSGSAALLQVAAGQREMRSRAKQLLKRVQLQSQSGLLSSGSKGKMDYILLALNGKKIGFGKVISMIDEMVKTLQVEQQDDDDKKSYCEKERGGCEASLRTMPLLSIVQWLRNSTPPTIRRKRSSRRFPTQRKLLRMQRRPSRR